MTGTEERRDPKAVAVAEAMMDAMGGHDALEHTRYLKFEFSFIAEGRYRIRRYHLWDRWEGRYRLEDRPVDGDVRIALFDTGSREGTVVADGEPLTGDAASEALADAYQAYINDTYWLMMPWKWLDPGVALTYVGQESVDGELCDVVELSFADVGLTPGDVYRGYVSTRSRLMIRWTYTLQGGSTGDWRWEYVDTGGIKLASTHRNAEGMEIRMGNVIAASEVANEQLFTDPRLSLVRKR